MRTSRRAFVLSTVGAALVGSAATTRAANAQQAMGPEDTAVLLAQYEMTGDLTSLLTYLHRDAAAIIPQAAITGWYRNEWIPNGPGPIAPYNTTYYTWTWEVNGVAYPNTAEVAFTQSFADGSVVDDVVRLVEYDGIWHWFFGRNRDFVNQQIANYSPGSPMVTASSAAAAASRSQQSSSDSVPTTARSTSGSAQADGSKAPFGVAVLAGLSADEFLSLAPWEAGGISRTDLAPEREATSQDGRTTTRFLTYYNTPVKRSELYPVGVVGVYMLAQGYDEMTFLDDMMQPVMWEGGVMKAPEVVQTGNDNGVEYRMLYENGSAAVGNVVNLYFTKPGDGLVYVIGSTDQNGPSALAEAMVSKARRIGA